MLFDPGRRFVVPFMTEKLAFDNEDQIINFLVTISLQVSNFYSFVI